MHPVFSRGLTALALTVLLTTIARADAVSDQKKAYDALGVRVPHPAAMCKLITKDEAARYLGKPVRDGESAGAVSGCAYHATDGSNDGVLVERQSRSDWYPPTTGSQYRVVSGLGEKAYTAYEPGIGYKAGVLTRTGTTIVLLSGQGTAANALALVRIAMNR